MKVFQDTPAVLSLGKLCDEHGYSYEWINSQKPHLITNGIRIQCNTENFVPIVVPGLATSSSSSLPSSTSMTPSREEIDHPTSSSSSSTSPTMTSSTASSESVARQERGDRTGWIPIPQQWQVNMLKGKNGESRVLLESQKSSCWPSQPKTQNQIKTKTTIKNGETCVMPIYRNGCKSSENILWMPEFLNTETHTPVLLMSLL